MEKTKQEITKLHNNQMAIKILKHSWGFTRWLVSKIPWIAGKLSVLTYANQQPSPRGKVQRLSYKE
jgi:hypothetical protein